MNTGFDQNFVWKISICSSVAYLLATIPQLIVDPRLKHDVNFPSRQYPYALYYIIPLCIVVFFATYFVMQKSRRTLLNILPFLVVALISIPIFRPEIPHGNLLATSFIWLALVITTLWICNRDIEIDVDPKLGCPNISETAKIEYLKEEVQFWRTFLLGIAGGYIAILISWVSFLAAYNKAQVGGNEAEAFILNQAALFSIGLYSIALIICPLAEASRKHREATDLFLTIKGKEGVI